MRLGELRSSDNPLLDPAWETGRVKLLDVELRRVGLPLVAPFRTSFSTQTSRDILLVKVTTPDGEGWGECVALASPTYSHPRRLRRP